MGMSDKDMFDQALKWDVSILNDDRIDKIFDEEGGYTPLHYLAEIGKKMEVLDHPSTCVVKDSHGVTPLHLLAKHVIINLLKNSHICTVKDNCGDTPLHTLIKSLIYNIKLKSEEFNVS